MVLAAGVGSRMRGSIDYPKSMIMLGGKSLIERILINLYENGVSKFVINTHYKADLLENHIRNLDVFGKAEILFSREEELLETAGGIKKALPLLDAKEFFIVNTDVFWLSQDVSAFDNLLDSWNPEIMDELLLLIEKGKAVGYRNNGDFDLGEGNILQRTNEYRNYVYIGAQIIKANFFDNIKLEKKSLYNIWGDLQLLDGIIPGVYGTIFKGMWLHIGDPESKEQAEKYFQGLVM